MRAEWGTVVSMGGPLWGRVVEVRATWGSLLWWECVLGQPSLFCGVHAGVGVWPGVFAWQGWSAGAQDMCCGVFCARDRVVASAKGACVTWGGRTEKVWRNRFDSNCD
ncbi:hypothetical protein Ssi02_42610 [Sinosporangium siamense]|uniref:Uncharacterized protein n=1 Tax=Sinosporangium siamense TaxID=1367973 RepID=A0A919RHL2_9ACTN|nr:hypothetical protein Ssi02_42610 [Sinosporangium siamense]